MRELSKQIGGKVHILRVKAVGLERVLTVYHSKSPLKMLADSRHWVSKCAFQLSLTLSSSS